MTTEPASENAQTEWTWEDWAIVEHALGELLHIGARYECFDKEYMRRAGELLEEVKTKKE